MKKDFDVSARAKALGVELSPEEVKNLKRFAKPTGASRLSRSDYVAAFVGSSAGGDERAFLAEYIVKSDETSRGQRMLVFLDLLGTGLFAVVGAQSAGAVGMNVVGATLVGCVAGLGGMTLNNLMSGATTGGVFWMRDPRFLAVAAAGAIATFYAWPEYEAHFAERQFRRLLKAARVPESTTSMTRDDFAEAMERDAHLADDLYAALESSLERETRAQYKAVPSLRPWIIFDTLNRDGTRWLHEPELRVVARLQAIASPVLYGLETIALGAVSIIGAQAGITRAINPFACVALGLTSCSGGMMRDLLCARDVAIGSQSYALATALGASVYVGLRQLVVRGWAIPLIARIGLAFGTTVGQRVAVYVAEPELATWPRPMQDRTVAPS